MNIPFINLKASGEIRDEIKEAVARVIDSGIYILGEEVEAFEHQFAAYCDSSECVGVGNGLEALSLTLRAWGIGPGDEVIVPAHTFIATALAVTAVGAQPVLVDVEEDTGLLDVDLVEAAISGRTRAVIPVHLYGQPVDMDRLLGVAEKNGLRVLEDAAQAHGARYKGRRVGSLGHAAAFSFYPTKNLGALGDGGAVTVGDGQTAKAIRQLGNYGSYEKYTHQVMGFNSRLDPIQAAVLNAKLPHLDRWNAHRRDLAHRYLNGLSGLPGIVMPALRAEAEPVWHVFAVRIRDGRRAEIQKALTARGIGTNLHYPRAVHQQPCYLGSETRLRAGLLPNAEKWAAEALSLPLHPHLGLEDIDCVVVALREVLA